MTRVIILIGLFFISGALLFWNPFWSVIDPQRPVVKNVEVPDFTAQNMTVRNFDETGYLTSSVNAKSMEYYEEVGTVFTQPSYIIYPTQGAPRWKITANVGHLHHNNKISLRGDVVISAIDPNESLQKFYTSKLDVDISTMIITSEQKIRIEGRQYSATGTGLNANLNLRQFEIIKDIKATYETPHP